jgi:ABC-2 type transport system ATP-binding protein
MDYILELSNLEKRFDSFCLENINIKLEPGYIMGLIGENGAGKTTLIFSILGLHTLTDGNVKVCGYDLKGDEKLAKSQMGFVLDDTPFLMQYNSETNAKMYSSYYKDWDQEKFYSYCKQFELDIKKPLKKLSKGNKMKFQLAFALSHHARLLVMDEPTAGLDPVFRRELIDIMSDVISDGDTSILFSTHLTDDLDKIADYITYLHKGKQYFSLSKEEMRDRYVLIKGTKDRINTLDNELIIGKKVHESFTEVLIHIDQYELPTGFVIEKPTIEEIMYFMAN